MPTVCQIYKMVGTPTGTTPNTCICSYSHPIPITSGWCADWVLDHSHPYLHAKRLIYQIINVGWSCHGYKYIHAMCLVWDATPVLGLKAINPEPRVSLVSPWPKHGATDPPGDGRGSLEHQA